MTAKIISGTSLAEKIRADLKAKATAFETQHGRRVGLAVVLVGDNPASQVYVNAKIKACAEVGIRSVSHNLPETTGMRDILALIDGLNADKSVDGILVQLPLPKHLDESEIISRINPQKDVDGFTKLSQHTPCTPLGVIQLIKETGESMVGKHAVVIGRSNIVGKPLALLLLNEGCTVTICHSKTVDLKSHTQRADILCVAVGVRNLVTADMVKHGAIVIDIGINRVDVQQKVAPFAAFRETFKSTKLCGDVDFDGVSKVAGWITPVPGGVGPMTIAMLLDNTISGALKLKK